VSDINCVELKWLTLVSFWIQFYTVMRHFLEWKKCCDVLCHKYVDPASIYRILCQIRPDPNRIHIHWIQPDPDPSRIHQIHQISGRIWIRCTPNSYNTSEVRYKTYLARRRGKWWTSRRGTWGLGRMVGVDLWWQNRRGTEHRAPDLYWRCTPL